MHIDSHQHFWIYTDEEYDWIPEDIIRRDFLPADLKPILEANDFDGCVAVQARQMEKETDWLLELAAESDIIKGIVGWIDLRAENVAERIAHYQQFDKIKGFRHVIQGEPDDRFAVRPEFVRGIQALKEADVPYDILIFPKQLQAAFELVKLVDGHDFVIDHIAKPQIRDGEFDFWSAGMKKFASLENVRCKFSGMVTETHFNQWQPQDFHRYMDLCLDIFGPNRLMIGSDWPVCLLSGKYAPVMNIVKDYIGRLSTDEQEAILGGTACEFYRLH